ncbi:MAG: TM2 domain-containing protein [Paludibacteraceae bacterium]|nr:TM2 domain-containing protein [Paludibacteraceae bacterium]
MSNITCPSCGGQKATPVNEQEYRCMYCGHTFAPVALRPVHTPQQFVSQPTFQQPSQSQPTFQSAFDSKTSNGKSRTTAAILGILLGGFGVHHFYLGNLWKGILYLLFCWTYIPAIIGFVEGIIYLTKSDEEFANNY